MIVNYGNIIDTFRHNNIFYCFFPMFNSNISDRLDELIKNESISARQFEKTIGCSNGLIHRCIRSKTDITSKWLSIIIETYPKYNAEWLLTGRGKMLNSNTCEQETAPDKNHPEKNEEEIRILQKECYEKGNRIIKLLDENAALRKELEEIKKATE